MKFFPIFVETKSAHVLVTGGGETALQKLRLLSKTEATITVVAPEFEDDILSFVKDFPNINLLKRAFETDDVQGKRRVYAAHDDEVLDTVVADAARAAGVLVNVVDTPAQCDFLTPSLVERAPITVAIGTEGTAPMIARDIKALLDKNLPANLGDLARQATRIRSTLKKRIDDGRARLRVWERLMQGAFRRAVLRGDQPGAALALEAEILAELDHSATETDDDSNKPKGSVSLIGAGPGNPEYLTLKAHRLLQEADVLVVDRLANPDILDYARRDAKRIYVGKQAGKPSTTQEEINQIIVREAMDGSRVVRLKGGDPSIFGRLQEELAACQLFGIEVEVVPGISAAQAASASIKLPLTFRGEHRSITLLTAATKDQVVAADVVEFMKTGRPFAIYMGVRIASEIVETLKQAGADLTSEVIIVENASHDHERVFSSSLQDLTLTIKTLSIKGPAILFIGLSYEDMGLSADNRIQSIEVSNVVSLNRKVI